VLEKKKSLICILHDIQPLSLIHMHYEGMGQAAVEMMEPFDKVSKDNSAPFSLDSHAL